ncbi:PAS domain S-box protein [Cyclobacterium xiamenense]|uniref:PAS domain S-box protein n=1 Tax=Cyclobacterium xiamenense TaxID=1297121 RepID=UPI0012B882EC|nr:PAS domain S-box protein [Cyclobacterium xiamenense]
MTAQADENYRWSKVLNDCQIGAWEVDPSQQSLHVSAICAEILEISSARSVPLYAAKRLFASPFDRIFARNVELLVDSKQEFEETLSLLSGNWVQIRGRAVCQQGQQKLYRFCGSLELVSRFAQESCIQFSADSGDLYRYLFRDAPMPMFIWENETLNMIDCNRQALLKYGYSREEFLQLNLRDIGYPEDFSVLKVDAGSVDTLGDQERKVWRHRNKAGDHLLVKVTGHRVDLAGKKCSMVLIQDITGRLEAEEQLLESLKELSDYRFALDAACLVMILDKDKQVVYLNQKFQKISGFDKESIEQASLKILYQESDRELIASCWDTVMAGNIWRGELRGRKRRGGSFWADTVVIPFRDNQARVYQYIWVGYDITQKKRGDEALAKERSLLRAIIDNLPIQIYVKDAAGRHIINNKYQYEDLLGAKSEWETLGKTVFDYFPEEIAAGMDAYDRKIVEEGVPVMNVEEFYYDREGKQVWLLTNKVPLKDAKGKVVGLVGMSRDVTDRKIREENLNRLNEELESKARALERSNQELEQFAYIASHDLQEPLGMITGFLGLLEKRYESVLDEKGKEFIFYAVDGASRMKNIIMDLLAYSRVGRIEEKVKELAIAEVITNILRLHKELIKQKRAEVTVGTFPVLRVPVAPIQQVFQNLISNALKYQDSGKVPKILVGAEERENFWEFYVRDNGIGIPRGVQDRVFQLFTRLHAKDQFSGSGIGLAMSKKIIENIGGTIGFHSEVGKGSTFYFTVPKTIQ